MAETDEIYELGWEPGFFWVSFNVQFLILTSSQMLHMEVPTEMSAECSIMERHKIVKIDLKLI